MYVYIYTYILCIYILYYHFMYILLQSDSKHTAYGRAEGETEEVDREGVCVCVHNFVLLQEHRKTVLEILGK